MAEVEFPFAELPVHPDAVVREIGGVGRKLEATLLRTIDALLAEAPAHARPRGGWVLSTARFDFGAIIAEQLEGAERLAVFLATLGNGYDRWTHELFARGDPFSGVVADAIGSVAAESAVDLLAARIAADAGGLGTTNRFSPGYCGWDVAEQHRLFAELPEGFLGVKLTEAALMVPLKSVSGVIGIGPGLTPREYPCDLCPREDCPTGRRNRG
jgi:hypothetical protein